MRRRVGKTHQWALVYFPSDMTTAIVDYKKLSADSGEGKVTVRTKDGELEATIYGLGGKTYMYFQCFQIRGRVGIQAV